MNILLSVENFYPRLGGGEVFVDELMVELSKKHNVSVVYAGEKKPGTTLNLYPQKKSFVFKNIPLFNRTVIRQYYANIRWKKLLEEKVAELKPDIIFTQLEYVPATVDVAKKHNIPSVVFLQNYDHFCPFLFMGREPYACKRNCLACSPFAYKLQHPWIKRFLKWHENALRNASFIFADSLYVAKLLKKFYKLDAAVLHPVLHADESKTSSNTREYITFINPIKTKGAEIMLGVAEKMQNTKFLVVGGKDRKMIERFKLLKNVNYLPWCDDMKKVYSKTKVLVVPSVWPEPFGRVVTEAQFNGIPCIVSSAGGLPEAAGDGGIVVKNYAVETSEIAICNLPASARSKKAISDCAQEHAPPFRAAVLDSWVREIKRFDNKNYYSRISKKAERHAQLLCFKKQIDRFKRLLGPLKQPLRNKL